MKAFFDTTKAFEIKNPVFMGLVHKDNAQWGRFWNEKDGEYTSYMGLMATVENVKEEYGFI